MARLILLGVISCEINLKRALRESEMARLDLTPSSASEIDPDSSVYSR